jgi:hypothetical protein
MFTRKNAIFVDYVGLPQHVKDEISGWHRFGNDCVLLLITSYRIGNGPQTPENMLVPQNFTELHQSFVEDGEFAGSFDAFLKEYSLVTHYWLACSGQDFSGIDDVYINICW